MKIRTERLTLEPITKAFLDSTCAYALNKENARLMVFLPPKSRAEVAASLQKAELERLKPPERGRTAGMPV